jgi:hypothetical protein
MCFLVFWDEFPFRIGYDLSDEGSCVSLKILDPTMNWLMIGTVLCFPTALPENIANKSPCCQNRDAPQVHTSSCSSGLRFSLVRSVEDFLCLSITLTSESIGSLYSGAGTAKLMECLCIWTASWPRRLHLETKHLSHSLSYMNGPHGPLGFRNYWIYYL